MKSVITFLGHEGMEFKDSTPSFCQKKKVDPDTVSEPKAKVHIYEKSGAGVFLVVFGCYLISDANR